MTAVQYSQAIITAAGFFGGIYACVRMARLQKQQVSNWPASHLLYCRPLGSGACWQIGNQKEPHIAPPPLGQHALPPIHLQTVGARPSSCNPYHCICMCCCTQYYLFEYVMNQRRRNAAYRVNAQTQGGIGSKRKS